MESTKIKGNEGEDIACKYLVTNDYQLLERNWQCSKYEVDIIAKKNDLLLFIEVKYRTGNYFGEPEIFVTVKQKRNLIRAANFYIDRFDLLDEVRFDIIAIVKSQGKVNVNHIEDAFKPEVNQY
jgi:putative endonuclease